MEKAQFSGVNWFTVKVRYTKQLENGTFKRVTEPYLVNAFSFTDAEARIYQELGEIIRGEFDVTSIAKTEVHDIFSYDDSLKWWKCRITYVASEHNSEKAKKVSQLFFVTAETAKEAYERILESLSSLMVEFEVPEVKSLPLVDVFPALGEELETE